MFRVNTNKRRDLCPHHGPHSAIPWSQTVCHRGMLVRNSFRAFAGKLCIFSQQCYGNRMSLGGAEVIDVYFNIANITTTWPLQRVLGKGHICSSIQCQRTFHSQMETRAKRDTEREKTEALPSSRNVTANALKVNPHPLLSRPCSKLFQIQTVELNIALREIWHLKGGYTVF